MPNDSTLAVHVTQIEPDIALITMDLPGSGANILNDQLFSELDEAMSGLAKRDDLKGVILYSAKRSIFVAGADLKRIVETLDWSEKEIIRFCEKGRAVMARFSRCPFVTVAAIHGACVGGGLELALWCDCRIATNDRRTLLGLPEVKLGLVPGWAGTARLPRISSFEIAADLITSGKLVTATEAHAMKFVDEVVDQEQLLNQAIMMIRRVGTSESFVRDRRAIMGAVSDTGDVEATVAMLGQRIVSNTAIHPFAPIVVLEHMERTVNTPIKEAWDSESWAMAQVYGSPASYGLLNHFFLVDHNKKHPGLVDLSLPTKKIDALGIVGAGLMGHAIADLCIQHGISIVLYDAVEGLAESVAQSLNTAGYSTVTAASSFADFQGLPLIIESVVETIDVKRIVLQKIESAVDENTIIASNTSAIPIENMAKSMDHPGRFCGIHFCHPKLMSLIEIVAGPQTSEQTIATAVGLIKSLRKMPVAINDGAGFVVNRLLASMIDESIRLFNQGHPIQAIDTAMRDFGFQAGPFEIIDIIGADTCMYAGRTMWESGLQCVTLSPILPRMIKSGRMGRKSGVGFYHYPDPQGDGVWDNDIVELIGGYRNLGGTFTELTATPSSEEAEQISMKILSAIVLEATHILDEEIVGDFRDIDLCIIHGFSFPESQGGILFWADRIGLKQVEQALIQISETESRMAPNERIRQMANQNLTFYPRP